MTRFAKIPEEILETLPVRLVGRYAWLAMHADWDSGKVPASSWSEAAALMRCSDRAARDALRDMSNVGAVKLEVGEDGRFVTLRVEVNRGVNRGVNCITPIIQRVTDTSAEPQSSLSFTEVQDLWMEFCEGWRGRRVGIAGHVPSGFVKAVRSSAARDDELRRLVRAAGESYRGYDGRPHYAESLLDRGAEQLAREETGGFNVEEW